MMKENTQHVIILVGLPGCGKTTFVNNFLITHPDYVVLSSDDILERMAKEEGTDYNTAWMQHRDLAEKEYNLAVGEAINKKLNIIIDRTNVTAKSRRKVLSRLPKTYKKTAIIFSLPTEEQTKRLVARKEETGKNVPWSAIEMMRTSYVVPAEDEGFNEIINFN